jgi:hypothetical protein
VASPVAQNVLISADTTAHLADFESVREECTGASTTYSRSASRSGSAVATRKYEAPEMRAGTVPKATAASDMYSYGVCALLACCDESSGVVFNAETEVLQSWDRERAHAKGGPHLPSLLDELLDLDGPPASSAAAAVGRRISAREVLRRPFLDPAAEREQARLETEAAAAASHEAGEQLAAVNREAVSKQREAEWQEAERRRVWEEKKLEQERALRSARLEAAVSKAKIEGRQRQLESQRRALAQQEAAAKQAEAAAAKAEAQGETARRAAKEEAAKLRAKTEEQRQKLAADKAREEADTEKRKGELKRQQAKVEEELKRLEQHKQAPPLIAHSILPHTSHSLLLLSSVPSLVFASCTFRHSDARPCAACKCPARRMEAHIRSRLFAAADPPRPRRVGSASCVLENATSRLARHRARRAIRSPALQPARAGASVAD